MPYYPTSLSAQSRSRIGDKNLNCFFAVLRRLQTGKCKWPLPPPHPQGPPPLSLPSLLGIDAGSATVVASHNQASKRHWEMANLSCRGCQFPTHSPIRFCSQRPIKPWSILYTLGHGSSNQLYKTPKASCPAKKYFKPNDFDYASRTQFISKSCSDFSIYLTKQSFLQTCNSHCGFRPGQSMQRWPY